VHLCHSLLSGDVNLLLLLRGRTVSGRIHHLLLEEGMTLLWSKVIDIEIIVVSAWLT
jgi:hypothetical protein